MDWIIDEWRCRMIRCHIFRSWRKVVLLCSCRFLCRGSSCKSKVKHGCTYERRCKNCFFHQGVFSGLSARVVNELPFPAISRDEWAGTYAFLNHYLLFFMSLRWLHWTWNLNKGMYEWKSEGAVNLAVVWEVTLLSIIEKQKWKQREREKSITVLQMVAYSGVELKSCVVQSLCTKQRWVMMWADAVISLHGGGGRRSAWISWLCGWITIAIECVSSGGARSKLTILERDMMFFSSWRWWVMNQ